MTGPEAESPARSTADFTWALATGETWRIGSSGRLPAIASGSRAPPLPPERRARPSASSGSITRSMGRRRSDSSPVSTVTNGWPARTPTRRRAIVPAVAAVHDVAGLGAGPPSPTPWITKCPGPFRATSAPSAATARSVARTVLALEESLHFGGTIGERAEEGGAVRDGLVARHPDRAGDPSDRDARSAFTRASPGPRARVPSSASSVAQSPRATSSRHRPRTASYRASASRSGRRFSRKMSVHRALGGRRDAGRVDEAAPDERKARPPSAADDERVGRQMRQVADLRDQMIVGLGRQAAHRAAEPLPEGGHRQRRPARACRTVGVTSATRPSNRSAVEASKPDRSDPAIGWPPTKLTPARAGQRTGRLDHAALDAAGVGQDGPGREMRPRGANEPRQRPHRRAEDDQARARDARRQVGGAAISRPRVEHRADRGLVARHHDHLAGEPPGPDAASDRAADEARADDGQARASEARFTRARASLAEHGAERLRPAGRCPPACRP